MHRVVYLFILLLFSCSKGVAIGGAKDMKKLLTSLFKDYDSNVRPAYNYSLPTEVIFELDVTTVVGLDVKTQVLKLRGFLRLLWTDELLQWKPEDHAGITEVLVPQSKVWKPDAVFYNGVTEFMYVGHAMTLVLVRPDGYVAWEPGFDIQITCKVDLTKYPFDVNICPVSIMSWACNNGTVKMLFTKDRNPVNLAYMMENGEFKINADGTHRQSFKFHGKYYEIISFNLKLTRRPDYIIMSLLMPVIMLAILCVVSFLLSPEEPEKVTVSITVLLSFTVFMGVIDNDLPETSDNIPLIVIYVTLLQAIAFLGVAGNVMVLIVHSKENEQSMKDTQSCTSDICSMCKRSLELHPNETSDVDATEGLKPRFLEVKRQPLPNQFPFDEPNSCGQLLKRHKKLGKVRLLTANGLNKFLFLINCLALFLINLVLGILMVN